MRDDSVPEALLAALDADRGDAVSQAALADWFEEHGDRPSADCLRWVVRNGRRPGLYERQSKFGHFYWERLEARPILNFDPAAQLPEKLWLALKGNDEPHPVSSFKSYGGPRAAYLALLEAWKMVGEAVEDVS